MAGQLGKNMSHVRSKRRWIAGISAAAAAVSIIFVANAASPISEDGYNRCRAIPDEKARLLCFESLTSPQASPSPVPEEPKDSKDYPGTTLGSQFGTSSSPIAGKWHLVRTPDPRSGRERENIISIMTTAELAGSDIDFAGLDLRCADSGFEVLIFLLSPLRPQERPDITINGQKLSGSVVSPGTAIQLPKEASDLAREQWRSLPGLSVQIENGGAKIHGVISLEGFPTALQTLIETCAKR